jgi:DNA protecting protein DprA
MDSELKQLSPSEFPALLGEIHDRPKQLYLRGTLPPTSGYKWLAVVGSRACSEYGRRVCKFLIEGLRGYPIVIVSGLAYGMDAEAHRNALDTGLPTVAVPGSGLDWDVVYPRANVSLAREILTAGGALLSEEKPDMRATGYTFPKRNRVMAGLSHATLMIEAREKSGSLITAKLTTEYNRELLVVPGSAKRAKALINSCVSVLLPLRRRPIFLPLWALLPGKVLKPYPLYGTTFRKRNGVCSIYCRRPCRATNCSSNCSFRFRRQMSSSQQWKSKDLSRKNSASCVRNSLRYRRVILCVPLDTC